MTLQIHFMEEIVQHMSMMPTQNEERDTKTHYGVLRDILENHTEPPSIDEDSATFFRLLCNAKINRDGYAGGPKRNRWTLKCHFVHHFDPFLKLGPFHLEVQFYLPFIAVFHDFFLSIEMDWLVAHSKPRLSGKRIVNDKRNDKRTVAKTVQTWFDDIKYTERSKHRKTSAFNEALMFEALPLGDPYNFTVEHELMLGMSKRIELATYLNITKRYAASPFQTTNYGLAGLVEGHHDVWGYESGARLVEDRATLVSTGDYIATFMGWINDVDAGGATTFGKLSLEPTKGSAAFWFNVFNCHFKDIRATHAGCPVLKGSKWIVNKWIYSFDQWKKWPCDLKKYVPIKHFHGMFL